MAAKKAPIVLDFGKPVSLHAWNATRTMCAVVHNDATVVIYGNCEATNASEWTVKYTLTNHDQLVSGLDWSVAHNKLVTCSHDRNAFVFTLDEATDKWVAGLVLLQLPRGCTNVCWSPNGDKIVVTSAYKEVRVCTYDPENDWWWPSDDIKKADKSTILAAAWHPNSQLLATASARKVCRVFSAFLEETDGEQEAGPFADGEAFGVNIIDFDADGWVEDVAWSPSGYNLAFVAHDSTLYVATFARDGTSAPTIQALREKTRPNTKVLFLSNSAIIASGHEMTPRLYTLDASTNLWTFEANVDTKVAKEAKEATSRTAMARSMFASQATLGHKGGSKSTATKHYKHRHSISDLRPYKTQGKVTTHFSTCCTGGRIVVWDVTSLDVSMSKLSL